MNATATQASTHSCAILASDFSDKVTDVTRHNWTIAKIAPVVEALAGQPVAITVDRQTGSTEVGVVLLQAFDGGFTRGPRLTVERTLSDGTPSAPTSTSGTSERRSSRCPSRARVPSGPPWTWPARLARPEPTTTTTTPRTERTMITIVTEVTVINYRATHKAADGIAANLGSDVGLDGTPNPYNFRVLALPVGYLVVRDWDLSDARRNEQTVRIEVAVDCIAEFGEHEDHSECARIIQQMHDDTVRPFHPTF